MNNPTETDKECVSNNVDTLNNCLKIFSDEANTIRNTHRPSSHGVAAAQVREIMAERALNNELKEVWE
tara:strand:+ start:230 stop:433 length:204 start_codon:yes stop_codon:yes gene_type:complete